jgi:hypothetical protein
VWVWPVYPEQGDQMQWLSDVYLGMFFKGLYISFAKTMGWAMFFSNSSGHPGPKLSPAKPVLALAD